MEYKIEIDSDSAAFEDNPSYEISRILRELADKYENGLIANVVLQDSNGNRVGFATVI